MRISNCQGLLSSLLRLPLASFQHAQIKLCISVSLFQMKIHKSQFEQNENVVVVVAVGIIVVVVAVAAITGTKS